MIEENIIIKKVDLLEALEEAFEAGWSGYKDLKESVVEKLFNTLYDKRSKETPILATPSVIYGSPTTFTVGEHPASIRMGDGGHNFTITGV